MSRKEVLEAALLVVEAKRDNVGVVWGDTPEPLRSIRNLALRLKVVKNDVTLGDLQDAVVRWAGAARCYVGASLEDGQWTVTVTVRRAFEHEMRASSARLDEALLALMEKMR